MLDNRLDLRFNFARSNYSSVPLLKCFKDLMRDHAGVHQRCFFQTFSHLCLIVCFSEAVLEELFAYQKSKPLLVTR